MKALAGITIISAALLTGCGKEPIPLEQAKEIAAPSEDAGLYHAAFAKAIQELSTEKHCQAEAMRDHGGFWRVSGESFYFIYCGLPPKAVNRWYFDPVRDELTQVKAKLQ